RRDGASERQHSVEELFSPVGRVRAPAAAAATAADELSEDEFGTIRAILLGAGKGGGAGQGSISGEAAEETGRMLVRARSLALAARPSERSPAGRDTSQEGEQRPPSGAARDPLTPAKSTRTAEFHTPRSAVTVSPPRIAGDGGSDDTFDGVTIEIDASGKCDDSALEDESLDSRVDRAYRRINRAGEEAGRGGGARARGREGAAGGGGVLQPALAPLGERQSGPGPSALAPRPRRADPGPRTPPQCSSSYDSVKHQLAALLAEAKELSPGKRSDDSGLGCRRQQQLDLGRTTAWESTSSLKAFAAQNQFSCFLLCETTKTELLIIMTHHLSRNNI
ncbi:hypothetical protein THAOC_10673, partial [Thalassiosira oceanica]